MSVERLPQYVSHAIIRAGRIERVYPTQLIVSADAIGAEDGPLELVNFISFHFPPMWFKRFDPQIGDVFMADGDERRVCSMESFLEGYTLRNGGDSRP